MRDAAPRGLARESARERGYPSAAELAQSREWKAFLVAALGGILAASGCASVLPQKPVPTVPAVVAPATVTPVTTTPSPSYPPHPYTPATPDPDPPQIEGGLASVSPVRSAGWTG